MMVMGNTDESRRSNPHDLLAKDKWPLANRQILANTTWRFSTSLGVFALAEKSWFPQRFSTATQNAVTKLSLPWRDNHH